MAVTLQEAFESLQKRQRTCMVATRLVIVQQKGMAFCDCLSIILICQSFAFVVFEFVIGQRLKMGERLIQWKDLNDEVKEKIQVLYLEFLYWRGEHASLSRGGGLPVVLRFGEGGAVFIMKFPVAHAIEGFGFYSL